MQTPSRPAQSPRSLVGRRVRVAALMLSVVAAGAIGLSLAPASADVQQTAAALQTAEKSSDDERAELREDMEDARKLEGEARRDAIKKIRDDAREGTYGEGVQRRLERRGDHRAAFVALLPDELQSDLKELKDADPDDREAGRDDIRKKALDGGYGDKVKQAYELLEKNRKG